MTLIGVSLRLKITAKGPELSEIYALFKVHSFNALLTLNVLSVKL